MRAAFFERIFYRKKLDYRHIFVGYFVNIYQAKWTALECRKSILCQ